MPLGYWAIGLLAFIALFLFGFCLTLFPIVRVVAGILLVIMMAIGFAALIGMIVKTVVESYPFGWK